MRNEEEIKEGSRISARKYYHKNKEKCKENHRKWRARNADYIRNKQKEDKRNRKLEAIEYMGGSCQKCNGEFHPSVYEFHHINPEEKDRDPSKMLSLSKIKLFSELDKCQLLCANCHRLIHHGGTWNE